LSIRVESQRLEKLRLETERQEKPRLETERQAKLRLETERQANLRLETERQEKLKTEREHKLKRAWVELAQEFDGDRAGSPKLKIACEEIDLDNLENSDSATLIPTAMATVRLSSLRKQRKDRLEVATVDFSVPEESEEMSQSTLMVNDDFIFIDDGGMERSDTCKTFSFSNKDINNRGAECLTNNQSPNQSEIENQQTTELYRAKEQRRLQRKAKYAAFQKRLEASYQTRLKAERLEKRKLRAERQWIQMLEQERQSKQDKQIIWTAARRVISQLPTILSEETQGDFDELRDQVEQLSTSISRLDELSKSRDSSEQTVSLKFVEGVQSVPNEVKQAETNTAKFDQSTLETFKEADEIKATRDRRVTPETTRGWVIMQWMLC